MLPTFLVIGAAKAGTTSLHAYLADHPEVFMSRDKELNYFIDSINWPLGQAWYESHFDEAASTGAVAIGEASPLYSAAHWYAGVPERMAGVVPDARLVYLVRHPIERMRSHYLHHLDERRETRSPTRAFRENPGYLNSSRYGFQLDRFASCFPRERILVVRTEELRDDRPGSLRRVFEFLGVDPTWKVPTDGEHHRTADKWVRPPTVVALKRHPVYRVAGRLTPEPIRRVYGRLTTKAADTSKVTIPPSLERELIDRLRPDIEALRSWLGPDFDCWGLY